MIARTESPLYFRPCLVLADSNSAQAALTGRQFRRLGWEVHLASSGPEARRMARLLAPQVVVLDTALRDESGWLTCAKLTQETPELKVVLLGDSATEIDQRFAEFIGATALVARAAGVPALLAEIRDTVACAQEN
jgi:CheY-like chemotaxis protein